MKKATIPLYALLFALISCKNDDNNNTPSTVLEGNWKLVQISGGITGNIENFTPGSVLWNFDESETQVTVTNNAQSGSGGLPSGTYQYSEQAEPGICNNFIYVAADEYNIDMGCTTIANDSLTFNNGYADGQTYLFVR